MSILLLLIGALLVGVPILLYLISLTREYVKLIRSNPKELLLRLRHGWQQSLAKLKIQYISFVHSLKKLHEAYLFSLEKWYVFKDKIRRFFKWRISDGKKHKKKGEKLGDKEDFTLFKAVENRKPLNLKHALDDEKAKRLSKLNHYLPKGLFKKLELYYVPARLYKMCEEMDGLKATKKYLNSIHYPLELLLESNEARYKFSEILDSIIFMERYSLLTNLSDAPFYALLEQRGVEVEDLEAKVELYRKASEIYEAIASDKIIFYEFTQKFKPKIARRLKHWGSITSRNFTKIYDRYQPYERAHLDFIQLRDDILDILEAIESFKGSAHAIELNQLKKNFGLEIEKIKNGKIGLDEWEEVLKTRFDKTAGLFEKYYASSSSSDKGRSSTDDTRGSSDTSSGTSDKKWKYTADFWNSTDVSGSGKTIEGSLIVLGLKPSERRWNVIKKRFHEVAFKWHTDIKESEDNKEKLEEFGEVIKTIIQSYNFLNEKKKSGTHEFK